MSKKKRQAQPQPPAPPAPYLNWRALLETDTIVLPALFAISLGLVYWTFDTKLGLSGDNTEFIILARSLAQGQGLSYINLPDPHPATKYPFAFPLMLAPLALLFDGSWVPMKWLVALLYAASMPVFYLLVRHYLGSMAALAATLLCATNYVVLDYAHQVMSEVPYMFFSLLALLLLERALRPTAPQLARPLSMALAALLAAYYVRSVGLVLIAAGVLYALYQRHWKSALWLGGGAFLGMVPWTLRNRAVGGGGVYLQQLLQINPYRPELGLMGWADLVERVVANAQLYYQYRLPAAFFPAWGSSVSTVILVIVAGGAGLCLWQRRYFLPLVYTLFYILTLALWPWTGERFLLPLVPLSVFFAVVLGHWFFTWLAPKLSLRPTVALAVVTSASVAVLNLKALIPLAAHARDQYPPPWQNYYAAGQWLKKNAAEDALVICRKSYWMHVISHRPAQVYAFAPADELLADLERKQAQYVVLEQLGFVQTGEFLAPAINQYRDRFEILWQTQRPNTYVLRLLPPSLKPDLAPVPPNG